MVARLASTLARTCQALLCALTVTLLLPISMVSAQGQSLIGTWALVWEGARDNYTGTLRVTNKVSDSVFRAKLTLIKSGGSTVTEDASLTVSGKEIRI